MHPRLELSPFVEGDLEAIADYIAQDNPPRAVTFLPEIRAELRRIGEFGGRDLPSLLK